MKQVLIATFLFCFSFAHAYEITVYGRNSCGFTANLRNELDASKVPYAYCNIDSSGCLGQLFQVAIEFNLAVNGQVNLPVVLMVADGYRQGFVRPTIAMVLKATDVDDVARPVSLYPNPASGIIHVSGDAEIYDLNGLKLIESHDRNVLVEGLKPGVYLVRVRGKMIKMIKR